MTITIQLPNQTFERQIPDSWNDCTPEQAMTLLQLLQLDGPNLMAKRLSALAYLLQLTDAEHREWQLSYAIEHGQDWRTAFAADLDAMLDSIGWLLTKTETEDGTAHYELNPSRSTAPFKAFNIHHASSFSRYDRRAGRIKKGGSILVPLYCAADGLTNITGEELAHAFTAYERYTAEPTKLNACRLIAIIYRKSKLETPEQLSENWYGDRRQPFNEHSVETRANAIMAILPDMAINVILFWFLSCRMAIIEQWPVVFKKADALREREDKPDFGWWGVYMALLEDPTRIDEFARKPYGDLFTTIAWYDAKAKEQEMQRAMASV